jgi:hypothetical protein
VRTEIQQHLNKIWKKSKLFHLSPESLTSVINLHFQIFPQIFIKNWNVSYGTLYSGKTDSWINLQLKISCQTPFKSNSILLIFLFGIFKGHKKILLGFFHIIVTHFCKIFGLFSRHVVLSLLTLYCIFVFSILAYYLLISQQQFFYTFSLSKFYVEVEKVGRTHIKGCAVVPAHCDTSRQELVM